MKSLTLIRKSLAITLTICLILPGASLAGGKSGKKNFKEGTKYAAMQRWDQAAQEFALAVAAEPENAEYRAHYVRSLMQASIMFVKRGDTLAEQNDYVGAYNAYRHSYAYDASNELARVKMQRMLDQQKAAAGIGDAATYNPHTGNIVQTSNDVRIAYRPRTGDVQKKIEIKDLNLKTSVASIGKTLGLNMIFDETVRDARFSIDLQDVTFAKALDLIFLQNKLAFELVDRKTIFVYGDNPTNKQKFERLLIKTFYLGNAKHTDVRTALQGFLGAAGGGRIITSIEQLNAVVVRATVAELQMIQDLISQIDKNRSEVVIDVNIYEISRTDAMQIGNQLALTPQAVTETKFDTDGKPVTVTVGQSASLQSLGGIGQLGVAALAGTAFSPFLGGIGTLFGLPPTGVSLLQSRGRSRLLYSSQIHALDGQQNQTKLGQSVPVRTGTNYGYQGATTVQTGQGQAQQPQQSGFGNTGGLFDNIQYKDVGLVIDVVPTITNEGYVEIKMKLESSSVEESGDTANLTPTFSQRSLSTTARVLDGVTAVVGGVKQDTKGEARATLPFIGMVPILGRFFSTPRDSSRETDLVITVTPHIIRTPEIKEKDHLAQITGPMQGGLSRSLEEVLQAVKEDEEQERRLITKQSQLPAPGPAPVSTPVTIAAGAPVNSVSGGPVQSSPGPTFQPPPVTSQPENPALTSGARLQEASFARPGESPADLAAASAAGAAGERAAEGQDKAPKTEAEKAADEKAAADRLAKELAELEKSVEKPGSPVAAARVVAPEMPDYVKERLDRIRADELKQAKEQKQPPASVIPEEWKSPRGPQQPAARAVVRPAGRPSTDGVAGAAATPVSITFKPQAARVQVGKTTQVEVIVQGPVSVAGALFVVKFDPAKMEIKAVRQGRLAGSQADVIYEVKGGDLQITLGNIEQKQLTGGGALVVIELKMLDAGEADIELNAVDTKLRLGTGATAQVTTTPIKLQVSR